MQMIRHILATMALVAMLSNAWSNIVYWEAKLQDKSKGDVIIRLADISAIALHTYKLDGSLELTECTIDTKGSHSFRFYAMADKESSIQSRATRTALGEAKKLSGDKTNFPARKFPDGAYSHNVEYQLSSVAKVVKVFNSIKKVWHCPQSTEIIDNID